MKGEYPVENARATDLSGIEDRARMLANLVGEQAARLEELGDRMYGPRPEKDPGADGPVGSHPGALGRIVMQLDEAAEQLDRLTRAVNRMQEVA
jgi:hypothetical protein